MTRRPLTLDDIAEIGAAVAERDRSEVFVLVSQIAAETIGWRMLTVLEYREAEGVVVRAHSSDPTGYPIGGTKRLADYTLNHAAMADGDCFLAATREEVRTTFADHEALFARGRALEASVEARVLLRQDPFNFNANLLLANAYQTLGLHQECIELCDDYLAVSGYCFELAELREQSKRRAAA